MKLRAALILLFALSLSAAAHPVFACDLGEPPPGITDQDRLDEAKRTIDRATVIIDGEIQPRRRGQPMLVRATRVLKGRRQATYRVVARTTCDRFPGEAGEKRRFVLFGGPQDYSEPYWGPLDPFIERALDERWPRGNDSKAESRK